MILMTLALMNLLGPAYERPEVFMERLLWIRDKQDQIVPLHLNAIQQKTLEIRRATIRDGKPRRWVILKARREGQTTLWQGLNYWTVTTRPNTRCVTLAHESEATEQIFQIADLFWRKTPDILRPKRLTEHDKRDLEFPALNSMFYIGAAGKKGFGRGTGITRYLATEVAFWMGSQSDHELLLAGLDEAAQEGEGVIESTPNGVGGFFHETYLQAKDGTNQWTPVFFPWYADPSYALPVAGEDARQALLSSYSDEERDLARLHSLSPGQIAWRREFKRKRGRLFPQEFPEDDVTCFLQSGICFFDAQLVAGYLAKATPGESKQLPGGTEVRWEAPRPGVEYVAGTDTSEGLPGCDLNGTGVMRRDTGAMVASVHGLFSIRAQAEHAVRLASEYNNALLGIERQNHGHAVLLKVADLGYGKSHLLGGHLFWYGNTPGSAKPGWNTSEETRAIMLDRLSEGLNEGTITPRDREFLQECLMFRLQPNGKFEAAAGQHDDRVVKWAIANMMRSVRRIVPGIMTYRPTAAEARG